MYLFLCSFKFLFLPQKQFLLKIEPDIKYLLEEISLKGDEHAFELLFGKIADGLYRFAFSILRNKELSEEAVSDVFFKLWVHREKLADIENFKAYIFTSVRNISLNYLDKEKRDRAVLLEDITVSMPIDEICPESELITKELKLAISRAIDNLPERCKLIYSLAKIEQLKYKEIAQILDISVKTIDHQLSIAVRKISDEIQKYLGGDSDSNQFTLLLHFFLPVTDSR